MKKIYFIRHAKSSWSEPYESDFQRGLNKRGKHDVLMMGQRIKDGGILPDIIISSPAKRAKKTSEKIAHVIGYEKEIIFKDSLYEARFSDYLNVIHDIKDENNSVFIFAHNPDITDVSERLGNITINNMPTCSIVCVEFNVESFKDIKEKGGKALFFDFPKSMTIAKYQ